MTQPTSRRRAQDGTLIRLSSNENPLGITPGAKEAIAEGVKEANRYPGWSRSALAEALAEKHGVGR